MGVQDRIFDIEIQTLVYGGDGMGRLPDGRAVFVPFVMPGEMVRVRVVEEKRTYARAELVEVLILSGQRVTPRCYHFGTCGGCHYQHMSYEDQLAVKTEILVEQFQRIGGVEHPPVQPMQPSPEAWNYRNNVQFQLTASGKIGYYEANGQNVFAIRECHLPDAAIGEAWPLLALEVVDGLERVELRSDTQGDILLVLESSDPTPPSFEVDIPISAVHLGPAGPVVLAGDDYITIEVLDRQFTVSAGSFFQVNTAQAGSMVTYLLGLLSLTERSVLIDVYCGVGLFSAFMAPLVQRCIGVEVSPYACLDFSTNLDEFDNVELYQGAAEDILPVLDVHPDAIVVDPPRAGLDRAALDAIVGMAPSELAYISCDPSTLARDARRLIRDGYRLESVLPFDLFPQTYHIESISLFRKM